MVSVVATFIGFCTAYTDYRYRFFGKGAYLALALLPPTIPLVIMGLAMLAWLSRAGLSGRLISIIIAHVVLCTPFAMAIVRLRLAQMDSNLEAAAWNLGAGEWRAMREVILPFTRPAIVSALCLTAAVSFDEFAVGVVRLGPEQDRAGNHSRDSAGTGGPADQRDRHLRLHHLDDAGGHRPGAADDPARSAQTDAGPSVTDALVEFEGVVKRFGDFTAVQALDLEITRGEFLAIMGPLGLRQDDHAADAGGDWSGRARARFDSMDGA